MLTDRPHCQNVGTCIAKTPGKHCVACAAASPETRARKAASVRAALADPEVMSRRQALARRIAADPDILVRKTASMRAAYARPEVRERHRDGCREAMARRMENPAEVEKMREAGRRVGQYNLHHANTPESRAKRGLSIRARHLSWCPPEQWAFNDSLKRKGFRLEERKRLILQGSTERSETGAETVARIAREMLEKHKRDLASRY